MTRKKKQNAIWWSKDVPYVPDDVTDAARAYLPEGPAARISIKQIDSFIAATRSDPTLKLEVLTVLRNLVVNGGEFPTSLLALYASFVSLLLAAALNIQFSDHEWTRAAHLLLAIAALYAAWTIARSRKRAIAAHGRKMVGTIWLAAYEDALRLRVEPNLDLRRRARAMRSRS